MQKSWLIIFLFMCVFFASDTLWSMDEFTTVVQDSCASCEDDYANDKDLVHVCKTCFICFCHECLIIAQQHDGNLCPNENCREKLDIKTREYSKRQELEELFAKKKIDRLRDSMQRLVSAQREGGERRKKGRGGIFGKLLRVFSTDE